MDLDEAYREVRSCQSDMFLNLDALELHVAASCWTTGCPDVIELGVRNGTSTIALLHALVDRGGVLWSVDRESPTGLLIEVAMRQGHWWYVYGESTAVLDRLPAEVACVFIDTWHSYDVTYEELEAYWPRVLPGGCVLLHDAKLKHVLDDGSWPVTRAAADFAGEHGLAFDFASRAGYGLGVLHRDVMP